MFLDILKQLGVDQSYFFQLFLYLVLLLILRPLLFFKLQEVLELRHAKTEGLEEKSKVRKHEAEQLEAEFNKKSAALRTATHQQYLQNKRDLNTRASAAIKEVEDEKTRVLKKELMTFEGELETQKTTLIKEVDVLSKELVSKLT